MGWRVGVAQEDAWLWIPDSALCWQAVCDSWGQNLAHSRCLISTHSAGKLGNVDFIWKVRRDSGLRQKSEVMGGLSYSHHST